MKRSGAVLVPGCRGGSKGLARVLECGIKRQLQVELLTIGAHLGGVQQIHHVLCAVDLGSSSEHAIREADRLARRFGAQLSILHVVPDGYPGVPMSPTAVKDALIAQQELSRDVTERLRDWVAELPERDEGDLEIEVDAGVPHEIIVQRANELGGAFVVLGAGNGGDHSLLGSVAGHVARHAPAGVLVSRARHVGGHVVAAIDFSEATPWAIEVAYQEACDRMAPLVLLHSLEPAMPEMVIGDPGVAPAVMMPAEYYKAAVPVARAKLAEMLTHVPGPGESLVVEEPPALGVPHTAQSLGADLVVLGAPHRGGFGPFANGAVAEAILRDSPCSVLIARQPEPVVAAEASLPV